MLKVGCMCLTADRPDWLPTAIGCFLAQTYPERRLYVVDNGTMGSRHLVPIHDRIVYIRTAKGGMIGDLRNYAAMHMMNEDVIAHWDDDDWSNPERLNDQVTHLLESNRQVTAYSTMKFTDGKGWWLYEGLSCSGVGSSLCYHREWWDKHRFFHYMDVGTGKMRIAGEDNNFISDAFHAGQFISVRGHADIKPRITHVDMMYATIHPGNTSPRDLKAYRFLGAR